MKCLVTPISTEASGTENEEIKSERKECQESIQHTLYKKNFSIRDMARKKIDTN